MQQKLFLLEIWTSCQKNLFTTNPQSSCIQLHSVTWCVIIWSNCFSLHIPWNIYNQKYTHQYTKKLINCMKLMYHAFMLFLYVFFSVNMRLFLLLWCDWPSTSYCRAKGQISMNVHKRRSYEQLRWT